MSVDPPSLTRIGVRFVLTLIAVMALWSVFIEPGYDRFIAMIAVKALRVIESPRVTDSVRTAADGVHAVVSHTEAYRQVRDQRLEPRTHHNNAPFLIALVLATPGLSTARRDRVVLVALLLLATTHVLHFMLEVHFHYAFANTAWYRVTDLRYVNRGLWQSLDNPAQVAKLLVAHGRDFYVHVGRLVVPILIWMVVCRDVISAHVRSRRAEAPT